MRAHLRLAGCAANIYLHVGALKALEELGIEPMTIAGTSAGAIVGSALASGMKVAEIESLILGLTPLTTHVLDPSLNPLAIAMEGGQCPGTKLEKAISDALFRHGVKHFSDTKVPFACFSTNMSRMVSAEWSTYTVPGELVAARVTDSARFPGAFMPRNLDGEFFMDGGLMFNYPVDYKFPNQDNTIPTIGLMVKGGAGIEQVFRGLFKGIPLLLSCIDVLMSAITKIHISDANWAKTIVLGPAGNGLDFGKSQDVGRKQIKDGWDSVMAWWKNGGQAQMGVVQIGT